MVVILAAFTFRFSLSTFTPAFRYTVDHTRRLRRRRSLIDSSIPGCAMRIRLHLLPSLVVCLLASAPSIARGEAADFPPGTFTDGGRYSLDDFAGKAVVLFFYEQDCPKCRGLIPERNKVVQQFKDKPVKFIAVAPGDSLNEAIGYQRGTQLAMPVFADALGVMQHRYGFKISLNNIYQFRVIGPTGQVGAMSMEPADIESVVSKVEWKYKGGGYDARLNGIIEMLEWNQYEPALRQLRPLTKGSSKTAESAAKLYEAVKAEGQQWLDEAAKAQQSEDVVKAYDLYTKVNACFAGDEFAKPAAEALKTLKTNQAVANELAARRMYEGLNKAMGVANARQRADVIGYCMRIAKQYPDTPTAKKAEALAKEIEAAGV